MINAFEKIRLGNQLITNTGVNLYINQNLITTGGPYYPQSNPNNFSTSGNLQTSGQNLYNYIIGESGAFDLTGSNLFSLINTERNKNTVTGISFSGSISQTGLIDIRNAPFGNASVQLSGSVVYISGNTGYLSDYYSIQNPAQFTNSGNLTAINNNLTSTGVTLGAKTDSLSGYLNNSFVDRLNPQSITGIKTFVSNAVFQSGSGINFYVKGEPVLTGIVAGTNITVVNNGGNFTVNSTAAGGNPSNGVTGISITGGNSISGTIGISAAANISLLQIGNTGFSIASTAAGGGLSFAITGLSVTGSSSITGLAFISGGTGILVSLSGNYININSTVNTGAFYPASNTQQYIKSGEAVQVGVLTQNIVGIKTFLNGNVLFRDTTVTPYNPLNYVGQSNFELSSLNDALIAVDINNRTLSGQWKSQFPPKVSGEFLVTGNQTTINTLAGGGGEINTASNIGIGVGMFSGKQGVDLKFYSITGGTGINISLSGQSVIVNQATSNVVLPNASVIGINANNSVSPLFASGILGTNAQIVISGTPFVGQNLYLKFIATGAYRTVTLSTGFNHTAGPSGLIWQIKTAKTGFYTFVSDGNTFWENDHRELRGVIKNWFGNSGVVPDDYALADGSNGTPNLEDRFLVSLGPVLAGSSVGSVGGSQSHSHSLAYFATSVSNATNDVDVIPGTLGTTVSTTTVPPYFTVTRIFKL